ncbi:hypothetical protein CASFOL_004698 [Castilleja foliolosa]|uniref:BHLH domain-containing protein n=1 Tax=Castilleja foliolosa TaxID=1961234 RepID=A0ABD3EBC6_9LAMI
MSGYPSGSGDDPLVVGSYSQLLFGDEISGFETDGCFNFTSTYSPHDININDSKNNNINNNSQKILCFGESGPACTDNSSLPISKRKRNGPGGIEESGSNCGAPTGSQRNSKKSKSNNSTVTGHAKVVRKEKFGDRITALQQLVSPFGKTDTASVLHEALGYIRFLHDQVHVLCSPYLQRLSTTSLDVPHHPDDEVSKKSERRKSDMRSQGLCLVPVELTLQVANSNGADLWSSGDMVNTITTLI